MKQLILFFTIFLMLATIAVALHDYTAVSLSPANNTAQTSDSVTFSYRARNDSTYGANCFLNTSMVSDNDAYSNYKLWSSVKNNTLYSYTIREITESSTGGWYWFINCSNKSNSGASSWTTKYYFIIDSVQPAVYFNIPTTQSSKDSDGNVTINVTAVDNNAHSCILYGNVNTTSNETRNDDSFAALETKTFTSGTSISFWTAMNTRLLFSGNFKFYVSCNDSARNWGNSSTYFVQVARGGMLAPSCSLPSNLSMHTKLTTFNWTGVKDSLFSYYNLTVNDSVGNVTSYKFTSNNTLSAQLTLLPDATYKWWIAIYDAAGNSNTSNCKQANPYKIYTAQGCSDLVAGWNACSWNKGLRENDTLSVIATKAGATYVSAWNYTGNAFVSYVGTTANAGYNVTRGDIVWIYMDAAASWEQEWTTNQTVWGRQYMNTTAVSNVPVPVTNITGETIKRISDRVNSTCDFVYSTTLFDSGRYTNFFCGHNESNSTVARYGTVLWVDFNVTRRSGFNLST